MIVNANACTAVLAMIDRAKTWLTILTRSLWRESLGGDGAAQQNMMMAAAGVHASTMTVLMITVYEPENELNRSDQITVPAAVWEQFDRQHHGGWPMFVELGFAGSGVVGRLRPAVPADRLVGDACRVPRWMWQHLGSPKGGDEDCWTTLTPQALLQAGTIVLRAREEATVTGSADPVAMLTAALTGSGGGPSWACLSVGAELPLACGTFDIMDIQTVEGVPLNAACILDCDVNLEFMKALDHVELPPPVAVRPPTPVPEEPMSLAGMLPASVLAAQPATAKKGFVPFSGVGRRLDGK